MTNSEMRKRVEDLAKAHGIDYRFENGLRSRVENQGWFNPETKRLIRLEKPTVVFSADAGDFAYAVNLHELGHLLHPTGMLRQEGSPQFRTGGAPLDARDWNLQIEEEKSAWAWAYNHATVAGAEPWGWTPGMEAARAKGLKSYLLARLRFRK